MYACEINYESCQITRLLGKLIHITSNMFMYITLREYVALTLKTAIDRYTNLSSYTSTSESMNST